MHRVCLCYCHSPSCLNKISTDRMTEDHTVYCRCDSAPWMLQHPTVFGVGLCAICLYVFLSLVSLDSLCCFFSYCMTTACAHIVCVVAPHQMADSDLLSALRSVTFRDVTRCSSIFTCAMLCIRGTSPRPVYVSMSVRVCLFVTSRSSTKTAKRRITQTTPHDTPGSLVF